MSALFSSPPKPATPVVAATAVPTQSSTDVQAAADAQRARAAQATGRNSTLLTGLDTTAAPSAGKTLLGA
jgi:hypothetical protein